MTDIVRTAAAYRDRLRSEIARIEEFIRMAEEFSRGAEAGDASPNLFRTEAPRSAGVAGRPAAERSAAPGARPAMPSAPKTGETKAPEFKAPEVETAAPAATTANPAAPETGAAEANMPEATPTTAPAAEPAPAAPSQSRWGLFRGTSSSPDDLRKAIAG